jgi:phage-related tail fiber protein
VKAASTGNLTLSGEQTVDGVALVASDRVLVKDQTTGSQNGIYVVAAGAWSRAADADSNTEVTPGMFAFVEQGTVNADSGWVLTNDGAITLGTTALVFSQFSGAGQITAGAGLTKSGNTLDIGTASSARIVVNPDNIDLATTGVTAATYTLAKVTVDAYGRVTAAYNGTADEVAALVHAASSKATPVDADEVPLVDSAASFGAKKLTWANIKATLKTYFDTLYAAVGLAKFSATVGDGSSTTMTVTHNLGSRNVIVQVFLTASPYEEVEVGVERYDANTVKLYFASAPASGAYTVVVIG